jgi:hypothetical protein
MEFPGHVQNGFVVPDGAFPLPEGAKVTFVAGDVGMAKSDAMTAEELARYRRSLAEIDAVPNEKPGDVSSGASHDQALYGAGQ